MKQNTMKSQMSAFQLKGSLLTLTVLELLKPDMQAIDAQFLSLVQRTPDLFKRMPIVVDLSKLQSEEEPIQLDFNLLKALLQSYGLVPVGIRGGTAEQEHHAVQAGLALLNHARTEQTENKSSAKNAGKPDKSLDKTKNNSKQNETTLSTAKLITQPVRSGQQIYAKDSDLIILASVSPGAEILATGNIHVYGTLHGRAIAGVEGDKQARIFCRKLKAELVSIAGTYWVSEDLLNAPHTGKDQILQIYLENDYLQIGVI
jgi:septum site-determining protein MinC